MNDSNGNIAAATLMQEAIMVVQTVQGKLATLDRIIAVSLVLLTGGFTLAANVGTMVFVLPIPLALCLLANYAMQLYGDCLALQVYRAYLEEELNRRLYPGPRGLAYEKAVNQRGYWSPKVTGAVYGTLIIAALVAGFTITSRLPSDIELRSLIVYGYLASAGVGMAVLGVGLRDVGISQRAARENIPHL